MAEFGGLGRARWGASEVLDDDSPSPSTAEGKDPEYKDDKEYPAWLFKLTVS